MPQHKQSRVMTLKEAADFLHVSQRTFHRYLRQGLIEGSQMVEKGNWRFREEDLRKLFRPKKVIHETRNENAQA